MIRENDVTVLLGETGSGKTTRKPPHATRRAKFNDSRLEIPQYLLESGVSGSSCIAVTQPRRVAATSLAARVAAEQNTSLGTGKVGYSVRFDDMTSDETKIKYVTDGMLVREMMGDPLLASYSVIVVDEAHERTLRTDILIAGLKEIQERRNGGQSSNGKGKSREGPNPLKIVIMSATLDAEKFSKFYNK